MAQKRKFTDAAAAYVKKLFRGGRTLSSADPDDLGKAKNTGKIADQNALLILPANVEPVRKDVTLTELWDLLLQFMKTFESFSSDLKKRQIIQLAMANTDAFAFAFSEKKVACKSKEHCHSLLVAMLVAFREEDAFEFDSACSQFLDAESKGYADDQGRALFQEQLKKALTALLGKAPTNTVSEDGSLRYPEGFCNLERFTSAMNSVHLHTFEYKEQLEAPTHRSKVECSDLLRKILMMFNSGGAYVVPKNAYIHEGDANEFEFNGASKNEFVATLEKALFNLLGEAPKKAVDGSKISFCLETK